MLEFNNFWVNVIESDTLVSKVSEVSKISLVSKSQMFQGFNFNVHVHCGC
jgi:hypothetical protein